MREILLVPWSLTPGIMRTCDQWLSFIDPQKDTVLLLRNFRQYCAAAQLSGALDRVLRELETRRITVQEVLQESFVSFLLERTGLKTITLTPMQYTVDAIAVAAACGMKGNLFVLNAENPNPGHNLQHMVSYFTTNPLSGVRTLDRRMIPAPGSLQGIYHYERKGKRMAQFWDGTGSLKRGVEGYVLLSPEPGYCMKIWDRERYQYANDKIGDMLQVNENPDIGLPLCFVYLEEREEPVGILMRYFQGDSVPMGEFYDTGRPFQLCCDVLKQLIWLESRHFYHWDVWHNVIVDSQGAHLIDLDSVQFAGYPATALNQGFMPYVPDQFEKTGSFGNGAAITYVSLAMLILLFLDQDEYNKLLWDSEMQRISINQLFLEKLPRRLQNMVVDAYQRQRPVPLIRQLLYAEEEASKSEYQANPNNQPVGEERDLTQERDVAEAKSSDKEQQDLPQERYQSAAKSPGKEQPTWNRPKKAAASPPKKIPLLIRLLIALCGSESRTVIVSPRGNPEDPWKAFVESKVWVKPLVYAVVLCVIIVFLLVALFQIDGIAI